jgi:lysophospholipase L1-like esterase
MTTDSGVVAWYVGTLPQQFAAIVAGSKTVTATGAGYRSGIAGDYLDVPVGALDTWQTAKVTALIGSGQANIVALGDSITAGQNAFNNADALTYGWVDRLAALLNVTMAAYANFYTLGGYGPQRLYSSGTYGTNSTPYNSTAGSWNGYSGGIGEVWVPNDTATWDLTITVPNHPVTGAAPTAVDLITVSYLGAATSWQYQVDGGSANTVNNVGSASLPGAVLVRTHISLTGGAPHTIKVGQQSVSNALMFVGHAVYYGTTGLGVVRAGLQGWRASDFTVGAGATAGSAGSGNAISSAGPDHLQPWTGVTSSTNTAGAGFPFQPHLAIIALGINDAAYGTHPSAYQKALARAVHAFRRGRANCSVVIMNTAFAGTYADNALGGVYANGFRYDRYKQLARGVANDMGCVYYDVDSQFGETAVAGGYELNTDPHPTANGTGAGGGDGHLLMAQSLAAIL